MKYRTGNGESLTLEEIRQRVQTGGLSTEDTVIRESDGLPVAVSSLMTPRENAPPPLPPSAFVAPAAPAPARPTGSLTWLWITLGGLLVAFLLFFFGLIYFSKKYAERQFDAQFAELPLLEDRSGHRTKWKKADPSGDTDEPEMPPEEIFELITYPAPAGDLAAYLTPDPGDGKRHPVMIWAKGGFGGIGDFLWEDASRTNDQSAGAFREAGIVLMCPSWRGENSNPGRFELFYGEVEDFLAAVEYARQLPYVDPKRVYLGGHSTGGTLVLLAAVSGADYRAAFSFGGAPDLETVMADGEGYDNTPYGIGSVRDHELRSSIRYTPFIRNPTFYFEGADSFYTEDAARMHEAARRKEVTFEAFEIEGGTHFDILAPVTKLVAEKIVSDTGDICDISFDAMEVAATWSAMQDVSLAEELKKWRDEDGDPANLTGVLDFLEDDAVASGSRDLLQLRLVIAELIELDTDEAADAMSRLFELGWDIEDIDLSDRFERLIVPLINGYIVEVTTGSKEISEEKTHSILYMLETLTGIGTEDSGELIARLAGEGFGKSVAEEWSYVFGALDPELPDGKRALSVLSENPPGGLVGSQLMKTENERFFDDEAEAGDHLYDSGNGILRILEWLALPAGDLDEEDASNAYNSAYRAAISLAFINHPGRAEGLEAGYRYPDKEVQIEIAWADLKNGGGARGLEFLQKTALDPEYSAVAKSYLIELDRESDIPDAALEPEFAATATMIEWLRHPNELGGSPKSIEVFDSREIFWPPSEEKRRLFLFKFTYQFDDDKAPSTGYGLVGSEMTWSSFADFESPPAPESLYVHHCALELSRRPGLDETEPLPVSQSEALRQLREKNPGQFQGEFAIEEDQEE